ncbi:AAA family ATPase [Deefgea salmonis]|uniref:AAA family ATPase n=1 Tax=Deefgea salmonis TaxID=2875502 RepID=A0ABS8BJ01_9NEIS|nr:AAA family ATPase [Deefgea salmonis]MCB5195708.1 AAA family ATPase [Deefgea salmonis]
MINALSVAGYKSISSEVFDFKKLVVFTGVNSSGKSTVLQSLLLAGIFSENIKNGSLSDYVDNFSDFSFSRNKIANSRLIEIGVSSPSGVTKINWSESESNVECIDGGAELDFEKEIYYLSAHRTGPEELAIYNGKVKCGLNGEYLFGFFDQHKDDIYDIGDFKSKDSLTLKSQLNWWLQYILDIDITLQSQKITSSKVKVSFSSGTLSELNPFNVGAGNSYVAKILILCLSCNKGDSIIIENPEIHLHPKAQAKLGEFFYYLAKNEVQVILETHCEHLINKVRYEAYKDDAYDDLVGIFYKKDSGQLFEKIAINKAGSFVDEKGLKVSFPTGFFDSTLENLMELPL